MRQPSEMQFLPIPVEVRVAKQDNTDNVPGDRGIERKALPAEVDGANNG